MTNIDIHSDDYALSINTSKDILDCCKAGNLDSFSIISNMPDYDACIDMLYNEIPNLKYLPKMSVHLNFVEGMFNCNTLPLPWGKLFLKSYCLDNKKLKSDIKNEIKSQIEKVSIVFNKTKEIAENNNVEIRQEKLRIDSHVHTHLIPIVFNALIEVLEEEKYEIEYIRNPKEPIIPFFTSINLLFTYSPINLLKNRILMLYSKKIDDYCLIKGLSLNYMCGLIMSGKMDFDRIKVVYPKLASKAKADNRELEFLFHPGYTLISEKNKSMNKGYFSNFNNSENRKVEKNTVMNIRKIIGEENGKNK